MKKRFVTEITLDTGQTIRLDYPKDKVTQAQIYNYKADNIFLDIKISDEKFEMVKRIVGDRIVERREVISGEQYINVNPEHIVHYITEEKEVAEEGES